MDLATTANRKLFEHAIKTAESFGIRTQQGVIFSTDTFYGELSRWDPWILRGVLGIDMETSILYSLADKNEVEALSVLVVSDNLITNESTSASEREEISLNAAKLVLEIA